MESLIVIGGGLAGCEAAWQAANLGVNVELYEMRPLSETGAHSTKDLAELVCSNSLGSNLIDRALGLLKQELRMLDSLLINCADRSRLPAGGALAVDRSQFSEFVSNQLLSHPNIKIKREHISDLPDTPVIIATGPLTSEILSHKICECFGEQNLFFYDAIAPIVESGSIDMNIAFKASRYNRSFGTDGDYINCPFTREQYDIFVRSLVNAEKVALRAFESDIEKGVTSNDRNFFESCLPVEEIARRGHKALSFGPMRPIGLSNPHTNSRPKAVVQLRQDNKSGSLYNLVGVQTNLTYAEQKRVFSLIPGLENAEFVRFGQMHRNTYINSPLLLRSSLQSKKRINMFFAGQITGSEGYVGSIATGLVAGINAANFIKGRNFITFPVDTMIGSLIDHIMSSDADHFQPMKPNFGLLPTLQDSVRNKRERAHAYSRRALLALNKFLSSEVLKAPNE